MSSSDSRGKPRGSLAGLQLRQAQLGSASRAALQEAIAGFLEESPTVLWTKIDISRRAGLKSTMPLHSKMNSDLLAQIDEHNLEVSRRPVSEDQPPASGDAHEKLAAAFALLDAENVCLQKENTLLKKKLNSLEKRLEVPKLHLHK